MLEPKIPEEVHLDVKQMVSQGLNDMIQSEDFYSDVTKTVPTVAKDS